MEQALGDALRTASGALQSMREKREPPVGKRYLQPKQKAAFWRQATPEKKAEIAARIGPGRYAKLEEKMEAASRRSRPYRHTSSKRGS